MVILRMRTVASKMQFLSGNNLFIHIPILYKVPAGKVSINNQFKNILLNVQPFKFPEIIKNLHIKIEAVKVFYPAHFYLNIKVVWIKIKSNSIHRFFHLV